MSERGAQAVLDERTVILAREVMDPRISIRSGIEAAEALAQGVLRGVEAAETTSDAVEHHRDVVANARREEVTDG